MKKNASATFWKWFQANEEQLQVLALLPDRSSEALEKINDELAEIDPALCAELGSNLEPKCDLIISSCGCRELIPVVVGLVHDQPRLACFSVTALRPRQELDRVPFTHNAKPIAAEQVFFQITENRRLLDVELYFDGYERKDHFTWLDTAYALLDAAIGEFDVATKLGEVSLVARNGVSTSKTVCFTQFSKVFDESCHNLMNALTRLSEDTRRETLLHRHLGLLPERLSQLAQNCIDEATSLSLECFFIASSAPAAQSLVASLERQPVATVFADATHTVLGDVHSVTCYVQVPFNETASLHKTLLQMGSEAATAKACLEDVCIGPFIEQSLNLG